MEVNGIIQRKLSLLDDQVLKLEKHLEGISLDQFREDWMRRSMAERALQVSIEIVIDIAERLIALANAGPVATAGDAIRKCVDLGYLNSEQPYRAMVGFRNFVVHQYEQIDPDITYALATEKLADFRAFRKEIDKLTAKSGRQNTQANRMPLSKHYLDTQTNDIPVDFKGMHSLFENDYQEVLFALVVGSASAGIIAKHSDLDIALYCNKELNWERLSGIMQSISDLHCDVRCDLGVLNNADPVYRYEALKGKLIFTRDQECWLRFYSLSCREYETQMFHYRKQRQYRFDFERHSRG